MTIKRSDRENAVRVAVGRHVSQNGRQYHVTQRLTSGEREYLLWLASKMEREGK